MLVHIWAIGDPFLCQSNFVECVRYVYRCVEKLGSDHGSRLLKFSKAVPPGRRPSGAPSSPSRIRGPAVVVGKQKPVSGDDACNA